MADITDQLANVVQQYASSVRQGIENALKGVGEEAKKKVKASSPRRSGKYSRGWRVDFQNDGEHIRCVVHQKNPTYRLTHLLEEGHKTRNGSRTKAQPHIRAVEEWAEGAAIREIEKAVKG